MTKKEIAIGALLGAANDAIDEVQTAALKIEEPEIVTDEPTIADAADDDEFDEPTDEHTENSLDTDEQPADDTQP